MRAWMVQVIEKDSIQYPLGLLEILEENDGQTRSLRTFGCYTVYQGNNGHLVYRLSTHDYIFVVFSMGASVVIPMGSADRENYGSKSQETICKHGGL